MADEFQQLVKTRRRELRLSYHSLAAACIDPESNTTLSVGWLHRLESGEPVTAPSTETLAALAVGLQIQSARLREAAAAQFFGLYSPWEASGEAADLLAALAVLSENQRRALVDLVHVIAKER